MLLLLFLLVIVTIFVIVKGKVASTNSCSFVAGPVMTFVIGFLVAIVKVIVICINRFAIVIVGYSCTKT